MWGFERRLAGQRLERRGRRDEQRAAAELDSEAAAFLVGRLAERPQVSTGDVPVWAWTNLLAHGSEGDLRAESAAECGRGTYEWRWRQPGPAFRFKRVGAPALSDPDLSRHPKGFAPVRVLSGPASTVWATNFNLGNFLSRRPGPPAETIA
jgi:hypothetical protein